MPTYIIAYTIHAAKPGVTPTQAQIQAANKRRAGMNDVMTAMGANKLGEQTTWALATPSVSASTVHGDVIEFAKGQGNAFLAQDWIGVYEINLRNTMEG